MRVVVRSRPSNMSVSMICGLTVVPETATRIGWASLPKPTHIGRHRGRREGEGSKSMGRSRLVMTLERGFGKSHQGGANVSHETAVILARWLENLGLDQ